MTSPIRDKPAGFGSANPGPAGFGRPAMERRLSLRDCAIAG
ncbi:MAG: hypothetical protein ACKOCX_08345 [Planctomycetota bacterium]